jgi:hypothetical protein
MLTLDVCHGVKNTSGLEVPTEQLLEANDPVLHSAMTSTEEGIKVERNKGQKWAGCFRRKEDHSSRDGP